MLQFHVMWILRCWCYQMKPLRVVVLDVSDICCLRPQTYWIAPLFSFQKDHELNLPKSNLSTASQPVSRGADHHCQIICLDVGMFKLKRCRWLCLHMCQCPWDWLGATVGKINSDTIRIQKTSIECSWNDLGALDPFMLWVFFFAKGCPTRFGFWGCEVRPEISGMGPKRTIPQSVAEEPKPNVWLCLGCWPTIYL